MGHQRANKELWENPDYHPSWTLASTLLYRQILHVVDDNWNTSPLDCCALHEEASSQHWVEQFTWLQCTRSPRDHRPFSVGVRKFRKPTRALRNRACRNVSFLNNSRHINRQWLILNQGHHTTSQQPRHGWLQLFWSLAQPNVSLLCTYSEPSLSARVLQTIPTYMAKRSARLAQQVDVYKYVLEIRCFSRRHAHFNVVTLSGNKYMRFMLPIPACRKGFDPERFPLVLELRTASWIYRNNKNKKDTFKEVTPDDILSVIWSVFRGVPDKNFCELLSTDERTASFVTGVFHNYGFWNTVKCFRDHVYWNDKNKARDSGIRAMSDELSGFF